MVWDARNSYLYDAEGRICAASGWQTMTGYLYDAAGNRVAKGTITSWSCDISTNGFQQTAGYVVDGGGQQLTEVDGSNNWKHTNVWANGRQIGTYDAQGLHYYFDDPLGTRRAQASAAGVLEATYQSLPYGDGFASTGNDDPTENHFTGKERDAESGNDYMFARYYNSSTGRFLSPDWDTKSSDPVPYAKLDDPQSLNLYGYVGNNPVGRADPDGHAGGGEEGEEDPVEIARDLEAKREEIRIENLLRPIEPPLKPIQPSPQLDTFNKFAEDHDITYKAFEADVKSTISRIQANAAQGKEFQDAVAAQRGQTNTNVVQNVTLKTPSGARTVMDVMSKDGSGRPVLDEAKSSATAPLTPGQKAAHPEIESSGATVVGKGKPGFPGGTKIPPTKVNVVRPDQQ